MKFFTNGFVMVTVVWSVSFSTSLQVAVMLSTGQNAIPGPSPRGRKSREDPVERKGLLHGLVGHGLSINSILSPGKIKFNKVQQSLLSHMKYIQLINSIYI